MTLAFQGLGTIIGKEQSLPNYIAATALDTTASVNGQPIGNTDGQISMISGQVTATNQTGTSPTLQLTLQGSDDGVVWTNLLDSAGATMQTSALSISTASTTNVAAYVDSVKNPRSSFPRFLRFNVAVGGSASPGGTYNVSAQVIRNAYRSATL